MGGVIDVAEADKTDASNELWFECMGIPVGQGSTRAFINRKTGRPIITHEHGGELRNWRQRVANEAGKVRPEGWPMDGVGYQVGLEFYFAKPKSAPKKLILKTTRPDIDKLIRAVLDGLTGVVFDDDAKVVCVHASKGFADGKYGDMQTPGVRVSVLWQVSVSSQERDRGD